MAFFRLNGKWGKGGGVIFMVMILQRGGFTKCIKSALNCFCESEMLTCENPTLHSDSDLYIKSFLAYRQANSSLPSKTVLSFNQMEDTPYKRMLACQI